MTTVVSYALAPPIPPPPPSPPLPLLTLSPMPRRSQFGNGMSDGKERNGLVKLKASMPKKGILKNATSTLNPPLPSSVPPPVSFPSTTPPLHDLMGVRDVVADDPLVSRPLQSRLASPHPPPPRILPPAFQFVSQQLLDPHRSRLSESLPPPPPYVPPSRPMITLPFPPKPIPSVPRDVTLRSLITYDDYPIPPSQTPPLPSPSSSSSITKDVVVETSESKYVVFIDLDGAPREGLSLSIHPRRRTLRISALVDGIRLFERKITFGVDADIQTDAVLAEFDGRALRVIVPRRSTPPR